VVVTFPPTAATLNRLLRQLIDQGLQVVVVDNASREDVAGQLARDLQVRLCLIRNQTNLGIAAAQNIGIRKALSLPCAAVLFLDQDSQIEPDSLRRLRSHLGDEQNQVIAPVCFDAEQGFGYPIVDISPSGARRKHHPGNLDQPVRVSVVISSGMLVRRKVFERVGLMDERLFIDYVDTEWCLRCASQGIAILVDPAARLSHSIGARALSLGRFKVPVHDPARRYYRIRNAFLLLRYPHVPLRMTLREILFGLVHTCLLAVSRGSARRHAGFYLRAVADGLRDRGGPYQGRSVP
jgi:rhamnosyltransferase